MKGWILKLIKKIKSSVKTILLTHEFIHASIIMLICLFFIIFYNIEKDFFVEHLDIATFVSFLLAFFANKLATSITSYVSKWIEDDFFEVKYTYSRNIAAFTTEKGMFDCDRDLVFPITIEKKLCANTKIVICDKAQKKYALPQKIQDEFDNIIQKHLSSTTYNQLNIRVDKIHCDNNTLTLNTSRTTFYDSLVTNRALEYKFTDNLTIKDLYCYGPFLPSLDESVFSNHLGFNIFVKTSDDYFIFIMRGDNVSIGKNTLGCGVSASLKSKYALNELLEFDNDGLRKAISGELNDELFIQNVPENFILDDRCNIIAFYRDWIEGGKPQLLIYLDLKISREKVNELFREGIDKKYRKKSEDKKNEKMVKSLLSKKRSAGVKNAIDWLGSSLFDEETINKVERTQLDGKKIIFIEKNDFIDFQIVDIEHAKIGSNIYPIIPTTIGLMVEMRKHLEQ